MERVAVRPVEGRLGAAVTMLAICAPLHRAAQRFHGLSTRNAFRYVGRDGNVPYHPVVEIGLDWVVDVVHHNGDRLGTGIGIRQV